MTLPTSHSRIAYTASAAQTVFPYTYLILAAAELAVYVDGVLQTLTTDYSVSGVGSVSGGNVTFVTGLTGGETVILLRATAITQDVNFAEGDRLPAETLETVLDRYFAALQDVREMLQRVPMLDAATALGGSALALPEPVASKVLRWNASGTALELVSITDTDIASPIVAKGDLIQGGTSGAPERLVIGASNTIASVSAGAVAWQTLATLLATLLTSNGDLVYRNGAGTVTRLPIGTAGQRLAVSGGLPAWIDPTSATETGEVTNLVVKHDGTNPAFKLLITADAVNLGGYRVTGLSTSVDLTASGAGGLDTGAEASNTHYYVWVIAKSSDAAATPSAIFSASATAPTMPAGYDLKLRVSFRRNDGSSNLIRAFQVQDLWLGDTAAMQLASAITATTDLDTSALVPAAIADVVLLYIRQTGNQWAITDKDDTTIDYWINLAATGESYGVWARKNASNLITAREVVDGSSFWAYLAGCRIKGL